MIVKVLAHGGEVDDGRDVDAGVEGGIADAGNLEDLRGVERPSSKNHFSVHVGGLDLGLLAGGELETTNG